MIEIGIGRYPISGRISRRIRDGRIPAEAIFPAKRGDADQVPSPDDIRHGAGYGLGRGATRARAGEGSE